MLMSVYMLGLHFPVAVGSAGCPLNSILQHEQHDTGQHEAAWARCANYHVAVRKRVIPCVQLHLWRIGAGTKCP